VIEPCGDALSGALMNAGPIIHPPLIVMNAGPIEHFERWIFTRKARKLRSAPSPTRSMRERIAVRERLGYGSPHFRWRIITRARASSGCMARGSPRSPDRFW